MTNFSYIASTEDDSIIDKFFKLVIPSEEREKTIKFTTEPKIAIDLGLQQLEEGEIISHKQTMIELKNRNLNILNNSKITL